MTDFIDGALRFGLLAFLCWLGCHMAAGWIQAQLDELRYQINADMRGELDGREYDGVKVFDFGDEDEV